MAVPYELTYSECQALLRSGVFGRIGLSTPHGPAVIPVNYAVSDSAILIRTATNGLLATHGRGVRVAFEIDHVDYTFHRGWSVMARGTTAIADDPDEVARLPWGWEPKPWASGDRSLLVTLPLTELTGRRLGAGWNPMSELPGRPAWSQPLP
jgi:hypothetical protein